MRPKTVLMLALPVFAALAVYSGTLGAGFVYDDHLQIEENPWVKQLRHLPTVVSAPVWRFRTAESTNYYRPLQMGLYNVLWWAGDGSALPFHLLNVLLHAASTALLALLVHRLTRNRLVATSAALLFAVHPANSEAVAWIACLPELGYSLALLLALLVHLSARGLQGAAGARRRTVALCAAAVAILFKETGFAIIPLVFLLELWLPGEPRAGAVPRIRAAARAGWPYAAVGIAYLALRLLVVGGVAPKAQAELGLLDALRHAPALFFGYLRLLWMPARLLAFHTLETPSRLAQAVGWPLLLAVPALLLLLARRRADLAVAGAIVAVPLAPVLYVPALGINAFAERYAYLPAAGAMWLAVAGFAVLAGRVSDTRRAAPATLVAALVMSIPLALQTVHRNEVWRDDETLARSVLAVEPRAWPMFALLGAWYEGQQRTEEALEVYRQGLQHHPENQLLEVNRYALLLRMGRVNPDEAVERFERMAESYPLSFEAWAMIGDAHLTARRFAEAEHAFSNAIEANPRDPLLYNRLAVVFAETGRIDEARRALATSLEISPGFELAQENLRKLDALERARP